MKHNQNNVDVMTDHILKIFMIAILRETNQN